MNKIYMGGEECLGRGTAYHRNCAYSIGFEERFRARTCHFTIFILLFLLPIDRSTLCRRTDSASGQETTIPTAHPSRSDLGMLAVECSSPIPRRSLVLRLSIYMTIKILIDRGILYTWQPDRPASGLVKVNTVSRSLMKAIA